MNDGNVAQEARDLLPYCSTYRQTEILEAIVKHKSKKGTSESLGISRASVQNTVRRVRVHREQANQSHHIPDGHKLIGLSTLTKTDDGEPQWVKTKADAAQAKAMAEEYIASLADSIQPRKRQAVGKIPANKDLMTAYLLGDHHWGMYAYAAETGGDYDLKIAKRLLEDAVNYLVDSSPASEQALFVNLGDYLHIDNRSNATPASGHILDVDSRFSKIIEMASFGMSAAIERLLEKHKKVRVINVSGNHDQDSAHWQSVVQNAWFRKEPRVEVDMSPAQFLYHQFGKNMVCMTHGHTCKLPDLAGIMAASQPEMWGATRYRVGWTGHVHHGQTVISKDNKGAVAESFPVLCPNDAYSASRGYTSQREMHAITLRKSGGAMARITYNPELMD